MTIADSTVLFRWTDSSFAITGWGWFAFILSLVLIAAAIGEGRTKS